MNKFFKIKYFLLSAAVILPTAVFANDPPSLFSFFLLVIPFVNNVAIPLVAAWILLYFVAGVYKYVIASGSEDKGAARNMIIHGLIGIFLLITFWAFVNMFVNTFGLQNSINIFNN